MQHIVVVDNYNRFIDPSERILNIISWLRDHIGTIDIDWKSTDGKAFAFKTPGDATLFALRWS